MSWARLLKRVFDIDIEHCPNCGGSLKIIAAIEDPPVIVKILTHLGLPARVPPRAPAQSTFRVRHEQLNQASFLTTRSSRRQKTRSPFNRSSARRIAWLGVDDSLTWRNLASSAILTTPCRRAT